MWMHRVVDSAPETIRRGASSTFTTRCVPYRTFCWLLIALVFKNRFLFFLCRSLLSSVFRCCGGFPWRAHCWTAASGANVFVWNKLSPRRILRWLQKSHGVKRTGLCHSFSFHRQLWFASLKVKPELRHFGLPEHLKFFQLHFVFQRDTVGYFHWRPLEGRIGFFTQQLH